MTQEELDALMAGELELDEDIDINEESNKNDVKEEDKDIDNIPNDSNSPNDMPGDDEEVWPPPATEDHKVVAQLDEVTKDSEEKATQILDIMDGISNRLMDDEENLNYILEVIDSQIQLMEKLYKSFAHIEEFKNGYDSLNEVKEKINNIIENIQMSSDDIMMAMDIMQFQDIHRQKVERVIGIMRALIKYMNRLFEGKVDDKERVKGAKHIHGDTSTEEVVSDEDIEALLEQFGKK